jgi:archaellum component FlaC
VRERDQSADLYADWKCLADGQSELIKELQAKVEKLEAGIATLWEVNECSDDLNEFRDLLCDLTGKERQ